MKLSLQRRTDLALSALKELEVNEGMMPRAELAERIGTTASFLAQVMSPVVQAGWVASERGPGGGYRLTDSAYDARVLDVIEAAEGPTIDGWCVMSSTRCSPTSPCVVHDVWVEARQVLIDGFRELPVLSQPLKEATK